MSAKLRQPELLSSLYQHPKNPAESLTNDTSEMKWREKFKLDQLTEQTHQERIKNVFGLSTIHKNPLDAINNLESISNPNLVVFMADLSGTTDLVSTQNGFDTSAVNDVLKLGLSPVLILEQELKNNDLPIDIIYSPGGDGFTLVCPKVYAPRLKSIIQKCQIAVGQYNIRLNAMQIDLDEFGKDFSIAAYEDPINPNEIRYLTVSSLAGIIEPLMKNQKLSPKYQITPDKEQYNLAEIKFPEIELSETQTDQFPVSIIIHLEDLHQVVHSELLSDSKHSSINQIQTLIKLLTQSKNGAELFNPNNILSIVSESNYVKITTRGLQPNKLILEQLRRYDDLDKFPERAINFCVYLYHNFRAIYYKIFGGEVTLRPSLLDNKTIRVLSNLHKRLPYFANKRITERKLDLIFDELKNHFKEYDVNLTTGYHVSETTGFSHLVGPDGHTMQLLADTVSYIQSSIQMKQETINNQVHDSKYFERKLLLELKIILNKGIDKEIQQQLFRNIIKNISTEEIQKLIQARIIPPNLAMIALQEIKQKITVTHINQFARLDDSRLKSLGEVELRRLISTNTYTPMFYRALGVYCDKYMTAENENTLMSQFKRDQKALEIITAAIRNKLSRSDQIH